MANAGWNEIMIMYLHYATRQARGKLMDKIQLFEDKKVRVLWNEDEEDWYFQLWML